MPTHKVVLTEHLSDTAAEWLAARVNLVRQSHADPAALAAELADAAGLLVRTYTRVDGALLDKAPNLKVVGRAGVGLDNVDLEACVQRGVRVVYTPDANTQAVVEYVWGLVLDHMRPRFTMAQYAPPPRFHELRADNVGRQLDRLTLGILGMGRIGRRMAQVAGALGMRVLYNDLLTRAELKLGEDDPAEFADPNTLWAESDVLTVHVDGRASNWNFIGQRVLDRLKPGCLLINTSRGFVVDPAALAQWATARAVDGSSAVLDVHEPEPPADDYPLFGLANVRLLPHLASRTETAMGNMSWVVRDVVRVLEGGEPRFPAPAGG